MALPHEPRLLYISATVAQRVPGPTHQPYASYTAWRTLSLESRNDWASPPTVLLLEYPQEAVDEGTVLLVWPPCVRLLRREQRLNLLPLLMS